MGETMARYTMELRTLVEAGFNCFDESWETFDEDHKPELCSKILRHYWFYEIGSSTPDKFKFYLNEQLALIMPYYNKLYESELLKLQPLFNHYVEGLDDTDRKLKGNLTKCNKRDTMSIKQMANSLQRLANVTENGTRNLDSTSNVKHSYNKTGEEDYTGDEATSGKEITDSDTSTDTTKNIAVEETVSTHDTMSNTLDGSKKTDVNSTVTTSSSRLYSDTPQAEITQQGINIHENYLTNYTSESGNQKTIGTTDETLKNVESKESDGTTKKDTTTTETSKVTGTEDKTVTSTETKDDSHHKTWTEGDTGNQDSTGNEDETTKDTSDSSEHEFSNGSVQDNGSSSEAETALTSDKEKTKRKTLQQGFTVSQAELLKEWRSTFINIDQMIIRDLAENFMGVYAL